MSKKIKRALVISGGGSKGAFAGGFLENVMIDQKVDYDILIGTSTGSLLIPHFAIGNVDKIKSLYTSIQMEDIYDVSPFKVKKKKDGTVETSINHINSIRRFLKGKKTFGEHRQLRKLLKKNFTKEDFELAKKSKKKIISTVSNLSLGEIEYKHIKTSEYKDYIDWMWASTSFVPFMSLVKKDGYEYADGGFGNYLPIAKAVELGANVIDAIVLVPKGNKTSRVNKSSNVFEVFINTIRFMLRQNANNDMAIGKLENLYNEEVKVNFYYTPTELTKYSFHFDPVKMTQWWQEGYQFAKKKFKV